MRETGCSYPKTFKGESRGHPGLPGPLPIKALRAKHLPLDDFLKNESNPGEFARCRTSSSLSQSENSLCEKGLVALAPSPLEL